MEPPCLGPEEAPLAVGTPPRAVTPNRPARIATSPRDQVRMLPPLPHCGRRHRRSRMPAPARGHTRAAGGSAHPALVRELAVDGVGGADEPQVREGLGEVAAGLTPAPEPPAEEPEVVGVAEGL